MKSRWGGPCPRLPPGHRRRVSGPPGQSQPPLHVRAEASATTGRRLGALNNTIYPLAARGARVWCRRRGACSPRLWGTALPGGRQLRGCARGRAGSSAVPGARVPHGARCSSGSGEPGSRHFRGFGPAGSVRSSQSGPCVRRRTCGVLLYLAARIRASPLGCCGPGPVSGVHLRPRGEGPALGSVCGFAVLSCGATWQGQHMAPAWGLAAREAFPGGLGGGAMHSGWQGWGPGHGGTTPRTSPDPARPPPPAPGQCGAPTGLDARPEAFARLQPGARALGPPLGCERDGVCLRVR